MSNVFTRVVNALARVWPLQSPGPLFSRAAGGRARRREAVAAYAARLPLIRRLRAGGVVAGKDRRLPERRWAEDAHRLPPARRAGVAGARAEPGRRLRGRAVQSGRAASIV